MRERLISAAVLVPVVVAVFLLGDPWLTLAIAILAGLAAIEAARLVTAAGLPALRWLAALLAPLAILAALILLRPDCFGACEAFAPPRNVVAGAALTLMAGVLLVAAIAGMRQASPDDGFMAWLGNAFAALYPGLLVFLVAILNVNPGVPEGAALAGVLDPGRIWILILVATVWSFDSLAYVAGKYHGRGRFMNHISPNKTWSGVVGGTAAAVLVCTLLVWAAGQSPVAGIVLGVVIAIAATVGDLAESMLKRAAGAKDSGAILPGHGGFLDRIDSFLFAAPAMFAVLVWGQVFLH